MNKIIMSLFMLFFISCDCPKEYDQFTKEELSWLPYEIGDTLKFRSKLGNEDKWVVTNKYSKEDYYGESSVFGNANCTILYYDVPHFELLHIYDNKQCVYVIKKRGGKSNEIYASVEFFDLTDSSLPNFQNNDSIYLKYLYDDVINLSIKKNVGISQYTLKDSNEIYEKY